MNGLKVDELDYIHFLVAAQQVFTTSEAARIREGEPNAPLFGASYTRPSTNCVTPKVNRYPTGEAPSQSYQPNYGCLDRLLPNGHN